VKQEDFRFNILYTDPSPLNYIIEAKMQLEMQCHFHNPSVGNTVAETPLLKVFNLDKLNYNDPQTGGDGFDFVQGITVDSKWAINFTTKEPFGELLFSKLSNTGSGENYDDAVLIIKPKEVCL
jgi:cell surface protein SprA